MKNKISNGVNFDVITIGSATRDAIFKSKDFKNIENKEFNTGRALAISLGSKIKIDEIYFTTGGAATNSAATFRRQGLKTSAIFRIGNDVSGKTIKEEMAKEKIDVSFIQTDQKTATGYSAVLEESGGERTILSFRGANNNLSNKQIPWNKFKTKWLYLSSLSGDLNILKSGINYKQKNDVLIAWNPGGEDLKIGLNNLLPYLKNIDVFIANQEEISNLLNIPFKEIGLIFKKFDEIIKGIAIITRGPQGSMLADNKTIFEAGIFKEDKIVDRTGAGDAFGSGFITGLIQKKYTPQKYNKETLKYALTLASANATSKVEHIGAKYGLLTKKEFLNSDRFKNLQINMKHK